MRVALFGGSFNPPHVAHQLTALYVLETMPVDELWFMPTFQHPFDKPLESFAHRFRMCELMAAALGERARVSDIEARMGGPSLTLRTVKKLIEDHPDSSFSLVIGSDLAEETLEWHGGTELGRLVPFIVVGRGGQPPPASHEPSGRPAAPAPVTSITMPAVSSREIRAAIGAGRDVSALVPNSVLDYFTSRGLYRSPATSSENRQNPRESTKHESK
jgi:nicotinate-nucleotide adenylyltransferase